MTPIYLTKNAIYFHWILVETSPPVHKAIESKPVQALINYGYIVYAVLPMSTLLRAPNLV